MTRKDSEKEADRPHYYSQFWLDVAAGRTTIGTSSKEVDETDLADVEDESEPELEPTPLRRAGRNHGVSSSDGYKTTRAQAVVEPDYETGEFDDTEENEVSPEDVEELELPDNVLDETELETFSPEEDILPDEDVTDEDVTDEDEDDFFDDEVDEEDEDEEDWSSRGRKKPKPGRQTKAPKSTKRTRREPRRGF